MKKSKKTIRLVGAGIMVLLIIGIGLYWLSRNPVMRCYLVSWSNLDQIANNVFVDPKMNETNREFLLSSMAEAETRITNLYGDYQSNPIIIASHTMDVMIEFGGNNYNRVGRTYLTALGQYIVFGPDGAADLDEIAHEIAHAELAQRIGYKSANALPDWFEEGLALQVDERFTEGEWRSKTSNGKTAPNLEEISTIRHDDWLAYATAKHVVSRWLETVGQEGLLALLQHLQQGEEFYASYQSLEDQYYPTATATDKPEPTKGSTLTITPTQVNLSKLQPITRDNANAVRMLEQYEIPGFEFVRETCNVAFSPDGKYLSAACMSSTIPVWEMPSGNLLYELKGNQIWTGVAFSPNSETLVSVGQSRVISFWEMQTGKAVDQITRSPGAMNVPVFSADGSKLAAGSFTGEALIWDLETKTERVRFYKHESRVNSVAFSPDGDMAASGGGDNLARVWDSSSGEEIFALSGANYFIEDVEFSPDGKFLLSASDDSIIRIWEMEVGELVLTLSGHNGPVNGIAYSPDGHLVASCGNDHTLRLWDAGTGEALAKLVGHENYAIRPAFSPNGNLIATIGWDGVLVLWGISSDQ